MGIAEGLGINASPSWLANNRFKFAGLDAAAIGAKYCERNLSLAVCAAEAPPAGAAPEAAGCAQPVAKPVEAPEPAAPQRPSLNARAKTVTASSALLGKNGYDFGAANLTDGKLGTSWQPLSAKGGVGEWALFTFDRDVTVEGLAVANGFQLVDKLGDLFRLNNRLAQAQVVYSDGASEKIVLDPERRGYQEIRLSPHKTRSLKLVVEAVASGEKWHDLAISELVVFGTD